MVHSSYHHWSSFHRSSKSVQKVSSTTIDMEVNNIFLFNVRVKTKRRALVVAIVPCFLRNVFHSFELVSVIWSQSLNFFDVQPFKFFDEAGDHVDLVPFLFWNRVWKNRLLHILLLLTFPRCGFLLLLLLLLRLSFLWLWLCLFSLCTVFGLDLFFSIRCLGLLVVISCIVIWVCFVRGWLASFMFFECNGKLVEGHLGVKIGSTVSRSLGIAAIPFVLIPFSPNLAPLPLCPLFSHLFIPFWAWVSSVLAFLLFSLWRFSLFLLRLTSHVSSFFLLKFPTTSSSTLALAPPSTPSSGWWLHLQLLTSLDVVRLDPAETLRTEHDKNKESRLICRRKAQDPKNIKNDVQVKLMI